MLLSHHVEATDGERGASCLAVTFSRSPPWRARWLLSRPVYDGCAGWPTFTPNDPEAGPECRFEIAEREREPRVWHHVARRLTLRITAARSFVADAISDVTYLVEEGPRYAKQLQESSQLQQELDHARMAADSARRELAAATRLRARLNSLRAPGGADASTLVALASTVSEVFRRLQWPFDFTSVAFADSDGTPEVLVQPRFGGGDLVPAHQRLSAGQRAALAISIFWTLNSSRVTVPRVMLMDEPVQSIDELNALNFLDCLRWLVERGGRQVFLSTSSRRLAGLVRKKFAYLGPRFVEVDLERTGAVAEVLIRRHSVRGARGTIASASAENQLLTSRGGQDE